MRKPPERHDANVRPIATSAAYQSALKEVEALMNANANTPEGDDMLVRRIEAYERAHFGLSDA